jgi:ABC-2 type transport system permease protein
MIKNTIEIAKKELKYFFDQPTGYLLLLVFVGLLYYFFLKTFFIDRFVSLRQLFQWLPWFLTVLIPAVTMSSFAKETESQTIEYILTKPIKKIDLIAGKIMGSAMFVFIGVLLTTPLLFFLPRLGKLDYGEVFASYFGALLFVFATTTIGVAVSSFFKNQITAFIFSVLIIFVLNITSTGFFTMNLPLDLANFLGSLSLIDHFRSLTRGVLLLEDIGYFVSIALISYLLTYLNLSKYQESRTKIILRKNALYIIWMLILIIGIFSLSKTSLGRLDLTSTKKYTLSETTKKIITSEGKINIDVYVSTEMPQEFQYKQAELKNILDDYVRFSKNNVKYSLIDPKGKEAELASLGLNPVEFRVYGQDEIKAKQGYFGLAIKNEAGDKTEIIGAIDQINNLEYEITKLIKKVRSNSKTTIAFASGNGERSVFEEYGYLSQLLDSDFEVKTEVFPVKATDTKTEPIYPDLSKYKLLVIANPTTNYSDESKKRILDFAKNRGNVIYLVDPIDVNTQVGQAVLPDQEKPRGKLLEELGINVNQNLAYDLEKFGYINMTATDGRPLRTPYPFFIFANKSDSTKDFFDNILFGWSATIKTDNNDWQTLFTTSDKAGIISENITVNPSQEFSQENLSKQTIASYREKDSSKIAVIGSARIFDNEFLTIEQNAGFGLKLFEKMTDTSGLSEIQSKNITSEQFFIVTTFDKNLVRFGAPVISITALLIIAYIRNSRKKRIKKKYH